MNINKLIDQLLPGAAAPAQNQEAPARSGGLNTGSLAAGAALGGVAGYLANSGTGRQMGRKALRAGRSAAGLGGLALIGTLAFKAVSSMRESNAEPAAVAEVSAVQAIPDTEPLLILRSMIAAAHADSVLDDQEQERILGRMQSVGLSDTEEQLLLLELHNPKSIRELSAQCTGPADSAAVYTAALLAISVDCEAEEQYLQALASGLGLTTQLATAIEAHVRGDMS